VSPATISYVPRKPHPLGFMIKTVCDTKTGILLNFDFVEGEEIDVFKEYNAQWGKSTGCTMRLVEPYANTGRTVIGDSWFGSVYTSLAMLYKGLHFVGNVKTGHKYFPKKHLL
jgi:Transposase IS4